MSISGSPISPESRRFLRAAKVGSKRRLNPIMQGTPAFETASAHLRARSRSRSTGFSQKIALPAAADRMMRSACVSVLEAMTTALTEESPRTLSLTAACAPYCLESSAVASGEISTTVLK